MINLYLFNEGSRAAIYGIGTYIKEMTSLLSCHEEISLNIFQSASDKKDFTIEKNTNYNIYYIPLNKQYTSQKIIDRYYRNIWYIMRQYIKSSEHDRLIFHLNYYLEYSLISLMKRDFPKCHTIFTIHYQDWSFMLNGNYSRFNRIIEKENEALIESVEKKIYKSYEKEKLLYSEIDTIICLGNYAKDILIKDYGIQSDKIEVINNGISDEAIILSSSKRKKLRQQLFIPEDEFIILFVGRLDEIKGVDALIEAFGSIVKDYPDSHLYIIGDGGMNNCMKKAEGFWRKITFTGRLKKEDVYKFYQVADVGVLPSLYEPFGYVAVEMMMFDIPIVATETSGLNEIITEGVAGYKIPVKETCDKITVSSVDIIDCIIKVIKSKRRIKKISRNTFLNKYTSQKMMEKYILLLNNKCNDNGKM